MPELPEVETTRRFIAPLVTGRVIVDIAHLQPDKYPHTSLAHGQSVQQVRRRGKYLIFDLHNSGKSQHELIVHLGMTGGFRREKTPHTRLSLRFAQEAGLPEYLHFHDPRRFGKVQVVRAGDYSSLPTLAQMGPEPLEADFSAKEFALAAATAGAVKPWLLSQRPVAGVGNIYADEALWQAKIHPAQTALTPAEARRLHKSIREVLAKAVELGGSSLGEGVGNYRQVGGDWGNFQLQHAAYGREGQPCPRCGHPIEKITLAQRGTHFCPHCQKLRR